MIGPPNSTRGAYRPRPMTCTGEPRCVRNVGSMSLRRIFHSSLARRVWMITTPDEKRPNSTAYGFGNTDTDSIAASGSDTLERPVDGSTSVLGPSWTPAWLGRPPLMLTPFGASITLARRRKDA